MRRQRHQTENVSYNVQGRIAQRVGFVDTARTLCNLMVVMIHARIVMAYAQPFAGENVFWRVVTGPVAYASMPTLFFLSGYLTAQGWSWHALKGKVYRRVRRLVVPYVLWNAIFVVAYLLTSSFIPSSRGHVEKWHLTEWSGIVAKILHPTIDPCDSPLWYMRSLVYLLFLSPPVFFCLKKSPRLLGVGILIAWLWFTCDPTNFNNFDHILPWFGVAAYCLGAALSLHGKDIGEVISRRWPLWFGGLALGLETVCASLGWSEPILLKSLARFAQIPLVLILAKTADERMRDSKILSALRQASFFVYASHFIACSLVVHVFWSIVHIRMLRCVSVGVALYCIGGVGLMLCGRKCLFFLCPRFANFLEGKWNVKYSRRSDDVG